MPGQQPTAYVVHSDRRESDAYVKESGQMPQIPMSIMIIGVELMVMMMLVMLVRVRVGVRVSREGLRLS